MKFAKNEVAIRELLFDTQLGSTSKVIYNLLLIHRKNTIVANAKVFKMHYESLRRHVRQLKKLDWVYEFKHPETKQKVIVPWMPLDVEHKVANMLERMRQRTPFWGEWLLKAMLDLLVDDDDYVDNSRPEWAVSGDGSSRLEFDRLYETAGVAIEFQGRQHYQMSAFTPDKRALQQRTERDGLKALACIRRNIAFVEFAANELSYDTVTAKLGHLLPLIPPRFDRPIFRTLTNMCHSYVNYIHRDMRDTHREAN